MDLKIETISSTSQNRQYLTVAKFLSGLDSSLLIQVQGKILASDSVPSLTIYSRILCISTGSTILTTPLPISRDNFALFSGLRQGRGRGRSHDSRRRHGRGSRIRWWSRIS